MTAPKYVIGIDPGASGYDKMAIVDWNSLRGRGPTIRDMMGDFRDAEVGYHGPPPLNFVESAIQAGERWEREIDPSLVVTSPRQFPAEFINDWIFGPLGEFTGFARIDAMSDMTRELRGASLSEGDVCRYFPRDRAIRDVEFLVECVYDRKRHSSLYAYQLDMMRAMGGREPEFILFVRFASYADYARWAEIAAHDNYQPPSRRIRDKFNLR